MEKKLERAYHQRILRQLPKLLSSIGFQRTRPTYFVRRREELVVEFIHLHKYTFDARYRVHLGVRVLNDDFQAEHLNGPDSHPYSCPGSPNGLKYNFRFDVTPASIEKCSIEIARWCSEVGLPWFDQFRRPESLLTEESPLNERERARLALAMEGHSDPSTVAASEKMFNCGRHVSC